MTPTETTNEAPSSRAREGLAALVGATLALVGAAIVRASANRLDRATAGRVAALRSAAASPSDEPITDADLADLPDPVRRYFESVLEGAQPHVRTARLFQRGELRLGEAPDDWKPFRATHHASVDPPGFLWDATVAVLPLLPARVVDAYEEGAGTLAASLLSTLPLASAGPDPETAEAQLQRFLAEAVWYPTALLADGVDWEAVDDATARATIEDRGTTASVEFRFDDRGLVESVRARRYRRETGEAAPWIGRFSEYEERNGLVVPTAAEVTWAHPGGERPYWRATVEAVHHDFGE